IHQKSQVCAGLPPVAASAIDPPGGSTMPFGLGGPEILLVAVIILVIFGGTKLPQLGDGLGKAIKNFKRSVGGQNEMEVGPKKRELKETSEEERSEKDDKAEKGDPKTAAK